MDIDNLHPMKKLQAQSPWQDLPQVNCCRPFSSIVPEKVQALVTTNQIGDGTITTKKLVKGAVKKPKLDDQSIAPRVG
jgi:hypothetical protein